MNKIKEKESKNLMTSFCVPRESNYKDLGVKESMFFVEFMQSKLKNNPELFDKKDKFNYKVNVRIKKEILGSYTRLVQDLKKKNWKITNAFRTFYDEFIKEYEKYDKKSSI